MKMMLLTEAAARLGVSRQTLENWGKNGVIKIKRMGKTRNANWVDADTINALSDTIADVENARTKLEQECSDVEESYRTIHQKAKDLRREMYMVNKFGRMCVSQDFYLSIPTMLENLSILVPREAQVMRHVIGGWDFEEIAEELGLTRERVRQIFFKGCRKAKRLSCIKDCLDENIRLKDENEELKGCIRLLRKELKIQQEEENEERERQICESDDLLKLLRTRIVDFDLSVRSFTCMKCAGIETVGDLCKYKKLDLLKLRNFGKKSLAELDDFIKSIGLQWDMDVDSIYHKRIEQISKGQ